MEIVELGSYPLVLSLVFSPFMMNIARTYIVLGMIPVED
jgi:hypothetical protein